MNEKLNKPITMAIKETKAKLISVINESILSPAVLDLIVQGIYYEVHSAAQRQADDEEKAYIKMINDIANDEGDTNESK
jgi:hypothetical protein